MEIRKRSLSGKQAKAGLLGILGAGWLDGPLWRGESFAWEPGQLIDVSTINEFPEWECRGLQNGLE